MEKIIALILLLTLAMSLSACSFGTCDICGKPAADGSSFLGKYICDNCMGF